MTTTEVMRIAEGIKCSVCRNYTWAFSHMTPVQKDGAWHHPSCSAVCSPPVVSPPTGVGVANLRRR